VFSLIGVFLIYFYRGGPLIKFASIFFSILVFVIILANIDTEVTVFSLNEKSNSVKVGHLISFIEQANAQQLLIGDGLASLYYSIGFGKITAQTEVFLLDAIRYFGLIGTFFFFCLLLVPLKFNNHMKITITTRYKEMPIVYLIFLLYLLMGFTNPILLNSYGVIVVLWFWSRVINVKEIT